MRKTNDSYCVVLSGRRTTERYYRDETGWVKVSARGRVFRATAEQVLNHLLPAMAFAQQLGLTVSVQHYDIPYWETLPTPAQSRQGGIEDSKGSSSSY